MDIRHFWQQARKSRRQKQVCCVKKKRKLFFATLFIIAVLATSLCYNVNTSNAGDTPTKKCQYKYINEPYKGKTCPYDALPDSNFCIWHEKKDEKNFKGKRIKDTDLVEAYLVDADLEDAVFNKDTNLFCANLCGANLRGVYLEKAGLRGADLEGVNLGNANLKRADLCRTRLKDAYLDYAHLEGAGLRGADLEEAFLGDAHLEGADLRADLNRAYLGYAYLEDTDLRDAFLKGAYLNGALLEGADLTDAHLEGADLSDADLRGTDLDSAHLEGADLRNTDLRASFLFSAYLKDAKNLQYAVFGNKYIEEIISDNAVKFLSNIKDGINFNIAAKEVFSPILMKDGLSRKDIELLFSESGFCDHQLFIGSGYRDKPLINRLGILCGYPIYRLTLYKHSRDVYIELKNYFKDAGYYVKSGQFFISEYRVRGKIYELTGKEYAAALSGKIKQFFKRLFHRGGSAQEPVPAPQGESNVFVLLKRMLGNYFAFFVNKLLFATSEYGESVSRVLFTAIVIIFIYAGIYSIKGSAVESNAKPEARKPIHDFWTNLYFSIVTFTTLGYGDLRPIPSTGIRLLAGSEAFLGAFTIAYFVVVVSRKIMR